MYEPYILAVLRNSKIFHGVDGDDLKRVLQAITPTEKKFERNQIIVNQGELVSNIGILKQGSAASVKYHVDGNSQILRIYNEGEVFSLDTVNTSLSTSPVTMISQTDCTIVFVPYPALFEFEGIRAEIKDRIRINVSEILSNELIRLMYKIDVLSKRTLKEKILTYLSLIHERSGSTFNIGMNQEEFARYLCVNRSVLSKELNNMRKSRLINYKGNRYTICPDPINIVKKEAGDESGHI